MTHALAILTHVAVIALILGGLTAAASMRLKWTKNADIDRTVFRVLGLSFAFTRYDPERWVSVPELDASYLYWEPVKLARPLSGAALGIAWSFWIYTRRHAYGRAMVCDWALLAYLQIIVADILVVTESGEVVIRPARRYFPGECIRVAIANRNPCRAVGDVTADVLIERGASGDRTLYGRTFAVEPGETHVVELDFVAPEEEVLVERVRYKTDPSGDFTVGRLHGRPEWEAA